MRIGFLFLIFSTVILCSCGTPQKGLWKYDSGAASLTVDKSNDAASVEVDFGKIRIQPFSVNEAYGFAVQVWVDNNSEKSISIKRTDFSILNAQNEVVSPLDEESIRAANDANVATSALYTGGVSYGMQSGVSSKMWLETKSKLLLDSEVHAKTTKKGMLFFPKSAAQGIIRFRIDNLIKPGKIISFKSNKGG